jgi:hypothetical protein
VHDRSRRRLLTGARNVAEAANGNHPADLDIVVDRGKASRPEHDSRSPRPHGGCQLSWGFQDRCYQG